MSWQRKCRCGGRLDDLPWALREDGSIALYCSVDCLPAPRLGTMGAAAIAALDAQRRTAR